MMLKELLDKCIELLRIVWKTFPRSYIRCVELGYRCGVRSCSCHSLDELGAQPLQEIASKMQESRYKNVYLFFMKCFDPCLGQCSN